MRLIAENYLSGAFCLQEDETPNANRLLEVICKGIGRYELPFLRILRWLLEKVNGLVGIANGLIPLVKKAYSGIEYSRKLSDIYEMDYVVVPFE